MADARIQDLTETTTVNAADRFVLEQSGQAKCLNGASLMNNLATALDGHGGINNIAYTPPVSPSLSGTITITLADGTSYDVSVTNGRGISSIAWESSGTAGDGMTHTGTISYNDGTTSTVQFEDGVKGDTGDKTYVWFRWSQNYPTSDSDMQNSVAPYIGIYSGTSASPPTAYTEYVWYQYKGEKGDTGSNIASITKTSTAGLVDTYTVTLTNGDTATFSVTNAKSIVSIVSTQGDNPIPGTVNSIIITFNDGDTAIFYIANGTNGTGSVSTVSGIQADGSGDVPQVSSGTGAPTTSTVGQKNQLYYDMQSSTLYYCNGENVATPGTYEWYGAVLSVDSALSGSSTHPVQNAVITNKLGTVTLTTTAQNVSDAINEHETDIGSMSLSTSASDLTGAINEHETDISGINTKIGPATLPTTAQTVTGAIAELDGNLKTVSRENLLDNWYFVGGGTGYGVFPVNQRGQAIYTVGSSYCIDRWKGIGNTVTATLASDGMEIAITGYGWALRQFINPNGLQGKKVTISALFSEVSGTTGIGLTGNNDDLLIANYSITSAGLFTATGTIPSDTTVLSFVFRTTGSSATFKVTAVKLEIGDTQTLAHQESGNWVLNEVPNYSEEFIKCQAYLARIEQDINARASFVAANRIDFLVPCPQNMVSNSVTVSGTLTVCNLSGTAQTGFTFGAYNINGGCCRIRAGKTSHGLTDAFLAAYTTVYISCEP